MSFYQKIMRKSAEQMWIELIESSDKQSILEALSSLWKSFAYYLHVLKYIQRALTDALTYGYKQKSCVYGFVKGLGILEILLNQYQATPTLSTMLTIFKPYFADTGKK